MRTCNKCGHTKPLTEFHKQERGLLGRRRDCKACKNAQGRDREYGLGLGDWDRMYDEQKGRCAICGKPFATQMIVVDHCHVTGRVRGLLHQNCNMKLGFLENHLELILDYIRYSA